MGKVGILANKHKPVIKQLLPKFFEYIRKSDHHFYIPDYFDSILPGLPDHLYSIDEGALLDQCELIVSFGGDGTILRNARLIGHREIPILGVNLGGLGFLTASSIELAESHINLFFKNKLNIEPRTVLKVQIENENLPHYFLNDLVIDKAGFSRLISITTYVSEDLLNTYIADGLIVATPTGSTAYSLANGGPIVAPLTNAIIINPICPHTLSNRPIIVSDNTEIKMDVQSEHQKFNVFGDGEKIGTYKAGTAVRLNKADYHVNLVHIPEKEFYTILREKLGWGEDFRNKELWSGNSS
jgi:NAD+ kinase